MAYESVVQSAVVSLSCVETVDRKHRIARTKFRLFQDEIATATMPTGMHDARARSLRRAPASMNASRHRESLRSNVAPIAPAYGRTHPLWAPRAVTISGSAMADGLPIFQPTFEEEMREIAALQYLDMLDDSRHSEQAVMQAEDERQDYEQFEAAELMRVLESTRDPHHRRYAAEALMQLNPQACVIHGTTLARLCEHSDPICRFAAVTIFSQFTPTSLKQLSGELGVLVDRLGDEDENVRQMAAVTLERCAPRRIAPHADALARLLYHSNVHVRHGALETMGRLDAPNFGSHEAALAHVAQHDEYRQLRYAARAMLGRMQLTSSGRGGGEVDWWGMEVRDRPGGLVNDGMDRLHFGSGRGLLSVEEFPTRLGFM